MKQKERDTSIATLYEGNTGIQALDLLGRKVLLFFFSSRRRHTRWTGDWSSDVCFRSHAPGQKSTPPLLGQAMVEFDHGQASLVFDGATRYGGVEINTVVGTKGTLRSEGDVCNARRVTRSEERRVGKEWRFSVCRGQ